MLCVLMASRIRAHSIIAAILALAHVVCFQETLAFSQVLAAGAVVCEDLDVDSCAYAVSSSGKRCVLEKPAEKSSEEEHYLCRSSEINVDNGLKDYVETEECIISCGLDRKSLGISSDALLDPYFTRWLCSFECYYGCPNIIDLYFSLAAGEGAFLPAMCEVIEDDRSIRKHIMPEVVKYFY